MEYVIAAVILCGIIVGQNVVVERVYDVYYDPTRREWTSRDTASACTLPKVHDKDSHTAQLRLSNTSMVSSEVWVGIEEHTSEWMEFQGCINRALDTHSDTHNSITNSTDPFLDCYNHCPSHTFMLTSKLCICSYETMPPEKLVLIPLKNIFVGELQSVMCMYAPAPINGTLFRNNTNENCVYASKRNGEWIFSNDLCSTQKGQICFSTANYKLSINKHKSDWFNSGFKCEEEGKLYPSYATTYNKSKTLRPALPADKEYWIGAFRRPLKPPVCFAAVLHSNGTIGNAHTMDCSDKLPSLCQQSDVTETAVSVTADPTDTGPGINGVHEQTTPKVMDDTNKDIDPIILSCILGAVLIFCVCISIPIFLCIKKRANRSQRTSTKLVQYQACAPSSLDGNIRMNGLHAEGFAEVDDTHVPDEENVIYHELHDNTRSPPTKGGSTYDHVTLSGTTEQSEYDVFCKKGKHEIIESDYDTTVGVQNTEEYGTTRSKGDNSHLDLNDYDTLAGTT